jgi:hypothetical protein
MSYLYPEAESLVNLPPVGSKQCVALIQTYAKAPPSSLWKAGVVVKGNTLLKKGTAIATFVNGSYPNHGTGNHAALYLKQDAAGIWVVDQWASSAKINRRRLTFKGQARDGSYHDPSNNGDAFSVIE